MGYLVLHQCYKRGHHNTYTATKQCRHLKGYALATAGRHKAKCVVTVVDTLDNVTLDATEIFVAPILAQNFLVFVHWR